MYDWASFERQFPLLANSLKEVKRSGRLAHSYLIVSSNADLRMEFPILLAMFATCESPASDGAPCGKCDMCRSLEHRLYPDLFILSPTSKSRQITIGADETEPDTLRNFEYQFYLSSSNVLGLKIGIIYDCDAMNESAQNAFLKTLEEPPPNSLILMTTGRPASLLPTIRSRCQILSLPDYVCRYDMERFSALPDVLHRLAFHAKNDLCAAESCAAELIAVLESLDASAQNLVKSKWESRLEAAQNLESAAQKLIAKRMEGEAGCEYRRLREEFLSILHTWFAQLDFLANGIPEEKLPNPELLRPWLEADPRPAIDPKESARLLNEAEHLLRTLRSNVNDALAVRSFAFNAAFDVSAAG